MRVAIYGAGQLGSNLAQLLGRRGVELVGPCGRDRRDEAVRSGAEVVVVATTSYLRDVVDDVRAAVESGSNVITSCEEAADPYAVDEALAAEVDRLARARGVTVLGTGLNPGYAFDALVLTALGYVWDVARIRVERVADVSRFGERVLRRIGVGHTIESFHAQAAGHIGFPQSMRVVARALELHVERVERELEPILAEREYAAEHLTVPPGLTAGFRQRYTGIVDGEPWFEAVWTGHLALADVGEQPRDEIRVEGSTPARIEALPGFDPQIGSAGVIANSLRRVVEAPPGWLTVADLPPATPGPLP